ncbi:MAG TPA: CsbD family protein [Jatrophihabitans sp.]|jgi:uncharacterized protein YjbJ (UPF0337 family)|nr:CsbD family protein [Jatrophihabitans sp.]
MGKGNKARNTADGVAGKAKEVAGRVSGKPGTEMRGRRKQAKADLKKAGGHTKDAGRKAKKSLKH